MSEPLLQNIVGVSKETIDKLGEIAPIIIIGAIWFFGAIAKVVAAGRKNKRPEPQHNAGDKQHQPDFGDFIRIVKKQYASAREQVRKAAEQDAEMWKPPAQSPQLGPEPYEVPPSTTMKRVTASKPPLIEVTTGVGWPEIQKPMTKLPVLQLTEEHPAESVAAVDTAAPHSYLAELAEQYTDPDGLRKAILHYEILGTPVGLRE